MAASMAAAMAASNAKSPPTVDAVGHGTDGEHAVGQRFPIDPPFGLVAMAWRDDDFVQAWLRRVMPRLTGAEIAEQLRVLAATLSGPAGTAHGGSMTPTSRCTTGWPMCRRRWSRPHRSPASSPP